MKVLIIIPAFNEEKSIVHVVESVTALASDYDYLVVNDGSTDNTYEVCVRNNIHVINLPVNLGIGGAMQTGYKYAYRNGYDVAVQLDGDGQHNPFYVNTMVEMIKSGQADLVIGSRFLEKQGFQSTFARRLGIAILRFVIKVFAGLSVSDCTSGFRACNRELIKYFAHYYPKDYPEPESIMTISRENFKVVEIPVKMNSREHGNSSIVGGKSAYYMVKVLMAMLLDIFKSNKRPLMREEETWL
jgi:glycosyltransferase involved in cell wall biosynthesis